MMGLLKVSFRLPRVLQQLTLEGENLTQMFEFSNRNMGETYALNKMKGLDKNIEGSSPRYYLL